MRALLNGIERQKTLHAAQRNAYTGSNISDSLLRTLWLQRLQRPVRLQKILVVLDGVNLEKLTACVNKTTECTQITTTT